VKIFGYRPAQIRKAIAGGLAGAVPLFAVDIADLHISRLEAGGLVGAFALGAYAVFKVKNAGQPTPTPAPSQAAPED
jgi:hypothetical protein